jgi:hypothetical protein
MHPQPQPQLQKDLEKPLSGKLSLHSSCSTDSLATTSSRFVLPITLINPELTKSSITTVDDTIHETWVLRCNRPTKNLKTRTYIFCLPLLSKHSYSPATYYVKPVLSSASETHALLKEAQNLQSPAQHIVELRKRVLHMDDDAQWEIQKLIEAREKAASGEKVCRTWEVVGLLERNRRKIAPGAGDRKWWKKSQKPIVEWVLVLKGETRDHKERVLPVKHEDPWKPKRSCPPPPPPPASTIPIAPITRPAVPQQQPGTVLRHVENRRVLSTAEAEAKMREIVRDLFVSDPESEDTEVEDSDEDDEEEEEEEESD